MVSLPLFSFFLFLPCSFSVSLCLWLFLSVSVSLCLCLCLWGPIYSLKCFHIFTLSVEKNVPVIQKITHIQVSNEISVSCQDPHTVTLDGGPHPAPPTNIAGPECPALSLFRVLFSQLLGTILQSVLSPLPLWASPAVSQVGSGLLGSNGRSSPDLLSRQISAVAPSEREIGISEHSHTIHFPKLSQCKQYPEGKGS